MNDVGRVLGIGVLAWAGLALASTPAEAQPVIAVPAGYSTYCSATGSGSAWGFSWSGPNPCATACPPGLCAVRQAGLWNPNGVNRVHMVCGGTTYWLQGAGATPLSTLKATAQSLGLLGCRFNVSPEKLPVLNRPYNSALDLSIFVTPLWSDANMGTGFGVDLAHLTSFTNAQLGISGSGSTSVLDHQRHRSVDHGFADGHTGYDWGVDVGGVRHGTMKVRAAARGRVLAARTVPAGEVCPGQKQLFVHHVVGSSLTSQYREEFYSYYAHLDNLSVATGDDVEAFDVLGEIGNTGSPICSGSIEHIHFGVIRIRNVTGQLMDVPPLIPHDAATTERRVVDPFGWNGPGVDPWAVHAPSGFGAASINLWISGSAPPDWNH